MAVKSTLPGQSFTRTYVLVAVTEEKQDAKETVLKSIVQDLCVTLGRVYKIW